MAQDGPMVRSNFEEAMADAKSIGGDVWVTRDGQGSEGYVAFAGEPSEKDIEVVEDWWRSGEWDLSNGTIWVRPILVMLDENGEDVEDTSEHLTIAIDPPEPPCLGRKKHEWEMVSARGHGGGVIVKAVDSQCGWMRITDTWAQDPETGEQGLTSVSYARITNEDL